MNVFSGLSSSSSSDGLDHTADFPPDHPLRPFHDYYTQADRCFPVLIQIRREWDQFLVHAEHPDGTPVPQDWVLPDQPSDDIWATALEK